MAREASSNQGGPGVRDRILATASDLFYQHGIRAVGVDLVVEKAGVAKTSLYRHFGTKDDLVVAFLQRMDEEFWKTWDEVSQQHLVAHYQPLRQRRKSLSEDSPNPPS